MLTRQRTLATVLVASATLAAALAALAAAPPALATADVTLTPAAPRAEWWGTAFDGMAAPPAPEACTPFTCDLFTLSVDVPVGHPLRDGGTLEVGARWSLEQNDYELYLMDASGTTRVAASEGGFSESETIVIPIPESGAYRVALVPMAIVEPDRAELVAELQPREALPEGDLLPNLVTRPPFDLKVVAPVFYATGTGLSVGGESGPVSCYADETLEEQAVRCLRFSNTISNVGLGDLEVRFDVTGAAEGLVDPEPRALVQRVYRGDGSHYDRRAGTYEIHFTHGHLHYESFAEYRVHAFDTDTWTVGDVVAAGQKSGFCPEDVTQERWDAQDTRGRRFSFPGCNVPDTFEDDRAWMVQGVTAGWGDTYTWDLPDQYVEISGLADGTYALVSTADPDGTLLEADATDNTAVTVFRLTGNAVEVLDGWEGAP